MKKFISRIVYTQLSKITLVNENLELAYEIRLQNK